jgi:RecG-like helicase
MPPSRPASACATTPASSRSPISTPTANGSRRTFKIGETIIASGLIGDYKGGRQMTHPDHVVTPDKDDELPEVEPVYPMTANLTSKALRKFMAAALDGDSRSRRMDRRRTC